MKIAIRILIAILLIILAMMGWWLLAIIGGILATIYYKDFYEFIAIGFVIDIVFGIPHTRWFHLGYGFTLFSIITVVIVQIIKSRVRRTLW